MDSGDLSTTAAEKGGTKPESACPNRGSVLSSLLTWSLFDASFWQNSEINNDNEKIKACFAKRNAMALREY